jgi:hypothetical protein
VELAGDCLLPRWFARPRLGKGAPPRRRPRRGRRLPHRRPRRGKGQGSRVVPPSTAATCAQGITIDESAVREGFVPLRWRCRPYSRRVRVLRVANHLSGLAQVPPASARSSRCLLQATCFHSADWRWEQRETERNA